MTGVVKEKKKKKRCSLRLAPSKSKSLKRYNFYKQNRVWKVPAAILKNKSRRDRSTNARNSLYVGRMYVFGWESSRVVKEAREDVDCGRRDSSKIISRTVNDIRVEGYQRSPDVLL
jgi:hypothetical protein